MLEAKTSAIINLTENDEKLRPLTNVRPIATLPFAGRYRMIDFFLSSLADAKITSLGIFIEGSGRSVMDHIRSGESWNLDSNVTGGVFFFPNQDIKKQNKLSEIGEDFYTSQKMFLKRSKTDYVVISGSKFLMNLNLKRALQAHVSSQKDVTVLFKQVPATSKKLGSPKDTGLILEDDRVVGLKPMTDFKQGETRALNLNTYILSVDYALKLLDKALEDGLYTDIDEVVKHYLMSGSINPYHFTSYVADIETIDDYYRANMDMLDRQIFGSLFFSGVRVLTKTLNGLPTFYDKTSTVHDSLLGTDIYIGGNVSHSILFRKCRVERKAEVTNSILYQGCHIGEGAVVRCAILDKGVEVEPGAKIIGTPDKLAVVTRESIIKAEKAPKES